MHDVQKAIIVSLDCICIADLLGSTFPNKLT